MEKQLDMFIPEDELDDEPEPNWFDNDPKADHAQAYNDYLRELEE